MGDDGDRILGQALLALAQKDVPGFHALFFKSGVYPSVVAKLIRWHRRDASRLDPQDSFWKAVAVVVAMEPDRLLKIRRPHAYILTAADRRYRKDLEKLGREVSLTENAADVSNEAVAIANHSDEVVLDTEPPDEKTPQARPDFAAFLEKAQQKLSVSKLKQSLKIVLQEALKIAGDERRLATNKELKDATGLPLGQVRRRKHEALKWLRGLD